MGKSEKTVALEAGRQRTVSIDTIKAGLIVSALLAAFIIFAKPISGLSAQGNGMIGATLLGLGRWTPRPGRFGLDQVSGLSARASR